MLTRTHLTGTQQRVFEAIKRAWTAGRSPTYRELGAATGLRSTSTVAWHVRSIERAGLIEHEPGKKRTIRPVAVRRLPLPAGHPSRPPDPSTPSRLAPTARAPSRLATRPAPGRSYVDVALVGSIPAGKPRTVDQQAEEVYSLPRDLVGEGELLLRVRGDSMIGKGIFDGDHVVVRRQASADDGDLVAARIEDQATWTPEATVKILSRQGGRVRLLPANPAYPVIEADAVDLIGKVTGVLRRV